MAYPFERRCFAAVDPGGGPEARPIRCLPIISADERLAEPRTIKGVLLGSTGVGKTWQLKTLAEQTTLLWDLEAGDLTVQDWRGDAIRPRTWEECRDLACSSAGPIRHSTPTNPTARRTTRTPASATAIRRCSIATTRSSSTRSRSPAACASNTAAASRRPSPSAPANLTRAAPKDSSPQAQAKRRIRSFADLDGLEFLARIDIGKDTSGEDKNEIRVAVTPDHKDYAAYMGAVAPMPAAQPVSAPTVDASRGPGVRPAWAQ